MKVEILKRIAALESRVTIKNVPDMVFIMWNDAKQGFTVREEFYKHDAKGNIVKGGTMKTHFFKDYQEYIFAPDFVGHIMIDLIAVPQELQFDLVSITAKKIRKKARIEKTSSFSLKVNKEGVLMVTEYQ